MRRQLLATLTLLAACCAMAQQAPQWVFEPPQPGNSTYIYLCEQGIGTVQQEAYNVAMARVFQSTANRIGQPFDSERLESALRNGTPPEVISRVYNIPVNKVCEYTETLPSGSCRVYLLCQVAVAGNIAPQWDEFSHCYADGESSNGTALLKSLFVPGLGQIGKGFKTEGVLTFAGELALVGGAVSCYYVAQGKLDVMRNPAVDYDDFTEARRVYSTSQTTSYILWGAAGALYAFNIIRAVSAKPRYRDGLTWSPGAISAGDKLAPALQLTFNLRTHE
ncbi:MAG: hypothetical protein IJ760_06375 [Bacteroidales bacterium]|nr:hypothetical protein [Bacteroidales bacterium]